VASLAISGWPGHGGVVGGRAAATALTQPAYAGRGSFLGIPGRLGRAVGESGPAAAIPAQPAYAGRARPSWESQEG